MSTPTVTGMAVLMIEMTGPTGSLRAERAVEHHSDVTEDAQFANEFVGFQVHHPDVTEYAGHSGQVFNLLVG